MSDNGPAAVSQPQKNPFFGEDPLPGLVALSWTMAGGVVAGGFLVASTAVSGGLPVSLALPTSMALCLGGGMAGFVHGGALGYLARRTELSRGTALESLGAGAVMALPGGVAAWAVAGSIALTGAWLTERTFLLFLSVALGWGLGVILCAWAAWAGWTAARRAFARWPEYREGTAILLAVFAVLAVAFLILHPRIWFTELRVSGLGALVLAAGATLWIALPVAVVILHVVHQGIGRWRERSAH